MVTMLFLLYTNNNFNRSNGVAVRASLPNSITKLKEKPVEQRCYRHDGTRFFRDYLEEPSTRHVHNASAYMSEQDAALEPRILTNYSNLSDFIENLRRTLMERRLLRGSHSIHHIFRRPPFKDLVKPSCDGLWMEFGVFRGASISRAARWKSEYCGNQSEPVYGFDTFSGLPTDWRPGFSRGTFAVAGPAKLSVPSNVVLVKGLFIDTLPNQLRLLDRQHQCRVPVSFVHIDCDIYDGTRDILFLLGSRFVPGTIVVFDELFNYPGYEKHEIKALFEFLSGSHLRLIPLGTSGNIQLTPRKDAMPQSFGFLVAAD